MIAIGSKVIYCGKFSDHFSLDGVVELVPLNQANRQYGIRNVNGNFHIVDESKVKMATEDRYVRANNKR